MNTYLRILVLFPLLAAIAGCAGTKTEYVHVGENWAYLNRLPAGEEVRVALKADRSVYQVGDPIEFIARADSPGKLWIITVGPDDRAMIIFPRDGSRENSIRADEVFKIPGKDRNWRMVAAEPAGANLVLAIVTGSSVTFEDVDTAVRQNSVEQLMSVHGLLSKWGSAKTVIEIRN